MTTIFDVALYILDKNDNMTTLKLQKLCYLVQGHALSERGKPLFEEDFQAWPNGPVCYPLFEMHRGDYGVRKSKIKSPNGDINLTLSDKEIIDTVLSLFGDKSPNFLKKLTHEQTPWKQLRIGLGKGERSNEVISKETMKNYFESEEFSLKELDEISQRRSEIKNKIITPIAFVPEPNEYDDISIEELMEL